IKELKQMGHTLILWTCRTGKHLDEAVAWCEKHGIQFDYINEQCDKALEWFTTDSRKIYADYYIDDKNILLESIQSSKCELSKRLMSELKSNGYPI
ncbi:MAG: hypothetical protein RR209_05200, partial [Angelakisella sp.]